MFSPRMLVPCLLGLLSTLGSLAAGEPAFYSIEMNGNPIGYSRIVREPVVLDGQPHERLISDFQINVTLLGKKRSMSRHSETVLTVPSGRPVNFHLTSRTNDVVAYVTCEFDDKRVRTWKYTDPSNRGNAEQKEIGENVVILGSNNFGHWSLILEQATRNAEDQSANIQIFFPDMAKTTRMELQRVEQRELTVLGRPRQAAIWKITGDATELVADADSGQLLSMNLPSQKTTITLADASVADKLKDSAPQELLATHFAQSNVRFDDFLKVRQLTARVDVNVIGSGVANPRDVLKTSMQTFDGSKEDATIKGTVTIHSRSYEGANSPKFPNSPPSDPRLARWTRPADLIESDDADIARLAGELTQGASTRWEAVQRISGWVHDEIAYSIADTPSARLALETRKGDCGPHATLAVAMLRSLGVPAKLVGGLVYTPMLGGSFGQHAWVEVHMGEDGWIAFDPTTGELAPLSAVHVKLFEGMGGAIPNQIEVVAFDPPNAPRTTHQPAPDRAFPWKLAKDYAYHYVQNGNALGEQSFQFTKDKDHERLRLKSRMGLKTSQVTLNTQTSMVFQEDGIPISFERTFDVGGKKTVIDCRFIEEKVTISIKGSTNLDREIEIPKGSFCFDNNLIPSFAAICSHIALKKNATVKIDTFHPSTMQNIGLTFQVKSIEQLKLGKKTVECYVCDVAPINNTFWISLDGRLLKVVAGNLVVEVAPVD